MRAAGNTSLVIIGRVILLLLAVVATVSAFALSSGRDPPPGNSAARYLCPMHPEVTATSPGECPICRMALEQMRSSTPAAAASLSGAWPATADITAFQGTVTAKRRVFALQVRAPAWLETDGMVAALLYRDELIGLEPGAPGLFFRAAAPGAGIEVRLTADPPAAWDGSTSRVHFRLADMVGRQGDVGWLEIPARSRELLVVPSSAVVYSPQGPHVLVPAPDGRTLGKRRVELGKVFGDLAVVLSGLREEEPIVAADAFFMDAERRLQPQMEETVRAAQ